MRLPAEDEKRIAALPATAARLDMALTLGRQIGTSGKPNSDDIRKGEGYMRASLAELVSVEDTLAWERPHKIFKLYESENPLLHVLRELRNMNVHLQPSSFKPKTISVQLRAEGSEPIDVEIFTVQDFTAERFKKLRNAARYSTQQINDLVNWFNAFHGRWGITDAIHQGICALTTTLIEKYDL